jgi:hypothetical protein
MNIKEHWCDYCEFSFREGSFCGYCALLCTKKNKEFIQRPDKPCNQYVFNKDKYLAIHPEGAIEND